MREALLFRSISAQREQVGTGSFYFGTFHNHSGKPLEGRKNYRQQKHFLLAYKYPLLAQSGAYFGVDQHCPAVMFQTHLRTQVERALSPIHITRLQ